MTSLNGDIQKMLLRFTRAIKQNHDTDFVQACLNNFLKVHHDTIVDDEDLSSLLESQILPSVEHTFTRVEDLLNHNICMAEYFAGMSSTY